MPIRFNLFKDVKGLDSPNPVQKGKWKAVHNFISRFDKGADAMFMNYGYADNEINIPFSEKEENERFGAQLYYHVANQNNIKDKEVLEIACGRGGGAAFLANHFKPKQYIATDISAKAIKNCKKNHLGENLIFKKADGDKQMFPDNSFDVVINIESSRCFANRPKVFMNVFNMLKPGGHFLIADLRDKEKVPGFIAELNKTGFITKKQTNISKNIVQALKEDSLRMTTFIDANVPRPFRKALYQFAAVEGSERYESFNKGTLEYWSFDMQKPE